MFLHQLVEIDLAQLEAVALVLWNRDNRGVGYLEASDDLTVAFDCKLHVGFARRTLGNSELDLVLRHLNFSQFSATTGGTCGADRP